MREKTPHGMPSMLHYHTRCPWPSPDSGPEVKVPPVVSSLKSSWMGNGLAAPGLPTACTWAWHPVMVPLPAQRLWYLASRGEGAARPWTRQTARGKQIGPGTSPIRIGSWSRAGREWSMILPWPSLDQAGLCRSCGSGTFVRPALASFQDPCP